MKHLALILDGNGRWAELRGLPRTEGHKEGVKAVIRAIEYANQLDIKYLSLYAFSAENFKRDPAEVVGIFGAIAKFLEQYMLPLMTEKQYKVSFIGDLSVLPPTLLALIAKVNSKGLNNKGLEVIIAVNYSGEQELARAFNSLIEKRGFINHHSAVLYSDIEACLYTAGVPNPDAVVRFGGHRRLSNFMPMQTVYSELFFLDKLWPDLSYEDLESVVNEYKGIVRKFGDVLK
ncbi:MAG: polyprenyl diphosphate synthase [Bacillota bacterium]